MGFFDRLAKHEALFQGMSDRLGIDFSGWIGLESLRAGDYRNAVLTCTACQCADACAKWQEVQDSTDDPAKGAPAFCRNKRMLDALAAR